MKTLLVFTIVFVGVFYRPCAGQGSTSAQPKPPVTKPEPKIAPALPINPPKPVNTNPTGQGVPRSNPGFQPNNGGVGVFNAFSNSPWGIPPPQQQMPAWNQLTGQYPNQWPAQINPYFTDIDALLDRMDLACGISQRLQGMMPALDRPDPYCECRMRDSCFSEGIVDRSGQGTCSRFGAVCCCSGTPYNSLLQSALLTNQLNRNPGFNPYQTQGRYPINRNYNPRSPSANLTPRRVNVPASAPAPNLQNFRSMWLK